MRSVMQASLAVRSTQTAGNQFSDAKSRKVEWVGDKKDKRIKGYVSTAYLTAWCLHILRSSVVEP